MKTYPEAPRRGLTADEITQVESLTTDRLRAMLPRLRDHWQTGLYWYEDAHRIAQSIGRLFGCSVTTAAGVLAALSPRIGWETNQDESKHVFEYGEDWGYVALRANVDKALDIIDGADPEHRLGGRKVRSFYRNILDPYGSLDVTLDGWMAYVLDLPKGHKYLERRRVYDAIADGFRTVAAEHGIMPHQLQATVWLSVRNGAGAS